MLPLVIPGNFFVHIRSDILLEIGFAASGKEHNFCKLLGRFRFEHFWKVHQRDLEERHDTDATLKEGVKLRCRRERHDIRGGVWLFCMIIDFWYIVVMSKRLAARSHLWDVFIFAFGMFSAEPRQFGHCIGFLWAICCRMVLRGPLPRGPFS